MDSFIQNFPIHTPVQVAWGEMDALQHVNNTVYFRYFESARIDFFDQLGLMEELKQSGIGPILAETRCRFKRPLFFPDRVLIGTRITALSDDRFTMEYQVFSQSQQAVTSVGNAEVVVYDFRHNRKATLPTHIHRALETHLVAELEASE
ncbi:acyl-CoA thioesterase [Ferrimonas sediminicola]|uniref:Acyl-CoA thioesterase n=1 Tax=Ferrimonas sediminicola TaxID=2569538 RepID=A0A4U1BE10_9GAMM|nr:thioesterase family protein [Ferrimonas sediminicola]TKB49399.1 acyl-CoA thioesterase [Ferrimonas sediminicola]